MIELPEYRPEFESRAYVCELNKKSLNKIFETLQHVEKSGGEAEALLPVKPAEATVPIFQRWRLRDRVLGGRTGTREDRSVSHIHSYLMYLV